jgi:cobyrinic acid a,c-diamide synthase
MKAAVIAAPMTGSGKTTVTLGLLDACKRRGLAVQPFKVGPDFIDPALHEVAAGIPSHNLDGWMLTKETNLSLFAAASAGKDVALVEGVMGLFDGFDGASDSGSTGEIAAWLNLPIILVVDANGLARSAAALVHGFQSFNPRLTFAGVIFNRVAGDGHFRILEAAVQSMPILGWLPADPSIQLAERHLGLMTAQEPHVRAAIERIGRFCAEHLNVDRIVDAMGMVVDHAPHQPSLLPEPQVSPLPNRHDGKPRVALARDAAFSFYYQANRAAFEAAGAEVIEFSPLGDSDMPAADLLYIGGGYPELYRRELAANVGMMRSVRQFIESGGRFYAECGGLMYLSLRIEDAAMVGIFPTEIRMTGRPVDFGYCEVTTTKPSLLGPAGTMMRGHQFHYSQPTVHSPEPLYAVRQGGRQYAEGWTLPNGVASYVHLHFLSNPDVVWTVLESSLA